jgi:hypothetical protein
VNEQGWDSFHYRQALYPLIQYGLLQPVEGEWPGATMHGLVQWRAKKHHSDQAWDKWYLIFMTAASWQMVLGQNEPLFRRYLTTHLLVDERLDMQKWRMEDKNESIGQNPIPGSLGIGGGEVDGTAVMEGGQATVVYPI